MLVTSPDRVPPKISHPAGAVSLLPLSDMAQLERYTGGQIFFSSDFFQ
jgi:hypothetical protein